MLLNQHIGAPPLYNPGATVALAQLRIGWKLIILFYCYHGITQFYSIVTMATQILFYANMRVYRLRRKRRSGGGKGGVTPLKK